MAGILAGHMILSHFAKFYHYLYLLQLFLLFLFLLEFIPLFFLLTLNFCSCVFPFFFLFLFHFILSISSSAFVNSFLSWTTLSRFHRFLLYQNIKLIQISNVQLLILLHVYEFFMVNFDLIKNSLFLKITTILPLQETKISPLLFSKINLGLT